MTQDDLLQREDFDAIARLTLNSPGNFNALSEPMLAALARALKAIAGDDRVRVVILRGAGKAFCAGHDLREMQAARLAPDGGAARFAALFADCAAVMQAIVALPQPVIAQVHGIATAAGCQLVASCDLALAAQDTRFGVNGVNIGLFCTTPMVALTRNVPRKQAFEMLVTGSFIDAARAEALGLINRAVPAASLEDETLALARLIATRLAPAVRIGKRAFHERASRDLAAAYDMAAAAMTENMLLPDTDEGIRAFLEKRKPAWHRDVDRE